MTTPQGEAPLHVQQTRVEITASDCQTDFRVTVPTLLKWLQEAAGRHADALNVGIKALHAQGVTWMLGRLCLRLYRAPTWGEALTLTTWPSGIRGRLVAERQFYLETDTGERLLEASSEWLCVNLTTGKLAPLPDAVKALALPDTTAFGLCAGKFPAPPADLTPTYQVALTARKAEMDANRHINNVNLAAWLREPLPDTLFFDQTPTFFDIEYKRPALAGDQVTSQIWPLTEADYLHHVTAADGSLIARARSTYSP